MAVSNYPKGKSGRLPIGKPSNHVPGDRKNVEIRGNERSGTAKECADEMSILVGNARLSKGSVFNK